MKAQMTMVICAFFLFIKTGRAQTITFDAAYDYNGFGAFGYSVQITPDSNYLPFTAGLDFQTGQKQPLFLYKINQQKQVIGLSVIGGDSLFWFTGLSGSLFPTFDGNYAAGGSVYDYTLNHSYGVLVKYNLNLDTVLLKRYENLHFDAFYNGIETSDHGYALVGFSSTYDSATQSYNDDCWLVKTDSAGNVQAQKTYGGTEDDVAIVISEISGKRLLFSGVKKFSPTNYTPWILITDFVGNILKEKELNDPLYYHCGGGFIIPAKDDAYLFRGYMDTMINNNDAPCAAYVSKMDTNFNFVWTTIYTGAADREIWNMRQLSDSSIVFVGFTTYNLYGWIGKLDKNGNKLWEREFQHGNSGANIFADFQQTPWDKGFILTGSTVENYNQDLWLVKLDSNGMLLPDTVNTGTFEVSNERFEMQLYPNPASEQTVVQYNIPASAKEAELTISDVQGRILRTEKLLPLKHTHALEVSEWAAGVYFITLKWGEDLITKKLLKQ